MVAKKFPEQNINRMRSCLGAEGWKEDDKLPSGWMIRRRKTKNSKYPKVHIVTADGKLFDTITAAAKFMEAESKYDLESIES